MTLFVTDLGTAKFLSSIILDQGNTKKLRLFSNDKVPDVSDVLGDYIQVSGGGYDPPIILDNNWTITPSSPSEAIYNDFIEFDFTDVTDSPGTIFGYYITGPTDDSLLWAERFPDVPFTPVNGAILRIKPRITCVYVANP